MLRKALSDEHQALLCLKLCSETEEVPPTLPTQLWTQKNSRLNQSSIFRAPCVCLSTPRVCSRFPSVSCPTSQSQGCSRFRCVSAFVLISLLSLWSSAEAPLVFVCFVSVIYLLAITLEFLFCTARSVLPTCSPDCCQNSWLVLMILHHSAIGGWRKNKYLILLV